MARWAVIGGSGFIGSAIVAQAEHRGNSVVVVPAPRLFLGPRSTLPQVEALVVSARRELSDLVTALSAVDIVVNAAGVAAPDSSETAELFGANAALPRLVQSAAARAGSSLFVHLSSVAVQGRMNPLTAEARYNSHSPYAVSKAMGEQAVLGAESPPRTVVVRATSVQGEGRRTTERIRSFARSPFASVVAPGTAPSPVSTVDALARFVVSIGDQTTQPIVVQPWDGLTVADVIRRYGDREPHLLPAVLCRTFVGAAYLGARLGSSRAHAFARRLEVLWLGQSIESPARQEVRK